jgi:hypothetical protein
MLPSGKEAIKIALVAAALIFISNKIPAIKSALGG